MADFTVRQGDDFTIADTLEDAAGNPVNIQNATIKFTLIPIGGGAPLLNAVAAVNDQVTDGSDGSKGKVHYAAIGGSTTATPGLYLATWLVLFGGTSPQAYPNGGYILFEITADAPVAAVTRFAESTDLETRLGLVFTADEHIRAEALLELASGVIQQETKQTIALVSGDTFTRPGDFSERIRLPQRPVVSVASATLNGVALTQGQSFYVEGDEIVRMNWNSVVQDSSFGLPFSGWGLPWMSLVVVYTHGYAVIPRIVKAVCLEMVVRVWVNPGAVARETIGNTSTVYDNNRFSPSGLLMTDTERKDVNDVIRRTSGSLALR